MMEALRRGGLIYVATPYSQFEGGLDAAFVEACQITARLIRYGVRAYSPIAHTHPIAIHGGLDPLSHDLWLEFDHAIMSVCDALCIAMMDGWEESYGVNYEREFFVLAGKPVFYLDPETMEVRG